MANKPNKIVYSEPKGYFSAAMLKAYKNAEKKDKKK